MATAVSQHSVPRLDPLDLWERGVGLDRWARDDALLAAGGSAPRGLGARNVAMLRLREALFGAGWPLRAACPECDEECGFGVAAGALADAIAVASPPDAAVGPRGPTVDDLRAAAAAPDRAAAVRLLLQCCGVETATEAVAADALERLDPGAVVALALDCPACDHRWSAALDVGEALWAELRRAAEAQMLEVDALARAYGWTEEEVLALSPTRRAAYLQLVGAA